MGEGISHPQRIQRYFFAEQRSVAKSFELTVIAGPLKERRFRLSVKGEPVRLGRTSRDIALFQDDQASLEHAELSWHGQTRSGEGFRVQDLGSETGTFINGARVSEAGALLRSGDTLQIGRTAMVLRRRDPVPPWAGWSVALGVPALACVVTLVVLAARPVGYAPTLTFQQPIGQGATLSADVTVPMSFVRRYGVDPLTLTSRRVTDFDDDGRAELWMSVGDQEVVAEVDAETGWTILAELPQGCVDRGGRGFPELGCGGFRYRMIGEKYAQIRLAGAIAWLRPWVYPVATGPDDQAPESVGVGPARPARVALEHPDDLAGFLTARGVTEPVHYLVCGGALPGVRAQVLTTSGRVQALEPGCDGDLRLDGPGRSQEFSDDQPVAMAFTAAGYEALLADARTYLSGGADGLFLTPAEQSTRDAFEALPLTRPLHLTVDGEPASFNPVAREAKLLGARKLLRDGGGSGPPPVTALDLTSAGMAEVPLSGCARARVEVSDWSCALRRWCTATTPFLRVWEVGCGDPELALTVPFGGGAFAGSATNVDVRAVVDVRTGSGQVDVLRARLAFRAPYRAQPPSEESAIGASSP